MSQADAVKQCVEAVLSNPTIRCATKYLSKRHVVKVSRPAYAQDKKRGRFLKADHVSLVVTVGIPGYREREHIARYGVNEPIVVKHLPLRRAC